MILKRRVSLGGVQLDSLDNRILISGIDEAAGRDSITGIGSGGNGQRITKKKRESLDITVKFTLKIRSDEMAEREALLQKIIGWAAPGGWLKLASRPVQLGQRVHHRIPGVQRALLDGKHGGERQERDRGGGEHDH